MSMPALEGGDGYGRARKRQEEKQGLNGTAARDVSWYKASSDTQSC